MSPEAGPELTAKDKVLMHLKDYVHVQRDKEFPVTVTQKGISEITGVRLSHVPRTMKDLVGSDLVGEAKAHVRGKKRRYKVYFLAKKGLEEANHIIERLGASPAVVHGKECQIADILKGEKGPKFPVLMRLLGEEGPKAPGSGLVAGVVPVVEGFVDRKEELAALEEMLDSSDTKVMVIYGSQGYGKSTLVARLLEDSKASWSACWLPVERDLNAMVRSLHGLLNGLWPDEGIEVSAAKDPAALSGALDNRSLILVCDGYFDVSEDVVEFFNGLVKELASTSGVKLIVTAREDTPSYNRFYTILDIHEGTVSELHLRGLNEEHCKDVLGTPDIDTDALRRLYLFTRGNPTTLKLLARGNEAELREKTKFLPEEIKLMLWLKTQER